MIESPCMDSKDNGERENECSGCSRAYANQKSAALQSPDAPMGVSETSTPGMVTGHSREQASVIRRYDSDGMSGVVRCRVRSPNRGAASTRAEAICEDWEASMVNDNEPSISSHCRDDVHIVSTGRNDLP